MTLERNEPPTGADDIELEDDGQQPEAYVRYEITTYPSDFTLEVLHNRWKSGEIIIPPFQRGFVWSQDQASLLIDSFLMGLPVPNVFFYVDDENKSVVIDGQQRLRSIFYFFEGYFGEADDRGKRRIFLLTGLNELNPFAGKKYEDLEGTDDGRKLRGSVLRAINVVQKSPRQDNTAIFHIFERLNKGMEPLTPQEIRNCIYRGGLNDLLFDLNRNRFWRRILGKPRPDTRLKDVELVLRLVALYRESDNYLAPMKEFLNTFMSGHRNSSAEVLNEIRRRFERAAQVIVERISDRPFRPRGVLNASLLDSVFATIMKFEERLPNDLHDRYAKLPEAIQLSFGTNSTDAVKNRFQRAQQILID